MIELRYCVPLEMTRGDTESFKFCRNGDNGQPILTSANKAYFTVKTAIGGKKVLQKTISDMTFNGETGYYSFTIDPADTKDLTPDKYVYDVKVIVTMGNYKHTVVSGPFTIYANVTDPDDEV